MYNHATNSAAGSTHWTIRTTRAGSLHVHFRDMVQLFFAQQNPEVHTEFINGNFVVQKSRRQFSLMAKDQAHEQSNKILQTKGGAAGLYENHEALMLFMLARPDCVRMVDEFEAIHDPPPSSTGHHEEGRSLQATFRKDISSFVKV